MLSEIRDILLISTSRYRFISNILGDGSNLGLKIEYKIQKNPNGLAYLF